MNNIRILADSTCDLSQDLIDKYDISIIPLMLTMGETTYRDGVDVTTEEIFQWSDATGETPKTSAPTIGDAARFLQPFQQAGTETIFFGISESMSATCNVLRLAADNIGYQGLHVVDSKNLSTGIGLQVLRAAELAAKGFTAEEIMKDNSEIKEKVRASFVVDTLTFLHRGGRCSGVTALIANTLKLKPEIVVLNGKMEVAKKYRGSQKSVILKYAKDREEKLIQADPTRVFITHSGCPKEIVQEVVTYLEDLKVFREILVTNAGGVISSHCGRNTLGILYINE